MRITRLPKIKGHRVFRDFTWPDDLLAFAQFNVIYGWNGSGKTALSVLFEHLQNKSVISQSEVMFELDGRQKISGKEIPTANLPSVHVFNRDFISNTIEAVGESNGAPIYFLGKESITRQKQVEGLKDELKKSINAVNTATSDKNKAESVLDKFCIEKGKSIRNALMGSSQHANYDKRSFRKAIEQLSSLSSQPDALPDEDKEKLRRQKEMQKKPPISRVSVSIPNIVQLRIQVSELLQKSIVSEIIDELANDPTVGSWVQEGLPLHKDERETGTCRFCGNDFSPKRRAKLEDHFNDAFKSFQRSIEQIIGDIEGQQQSLQMVAFPDESRFYNHLVNEARQSVSAAKQEINSINLALNLLINALKIKKRLHFESLALEVDGSVTDPSVASLSAVIARVNAIIEKHEEITNNLNDEIKRACQLLEQDYVLESLPRFNELTNDVTRMSTTLTAIQGKPEELEKQISTIEGEIVEHRRPIEELNRELQAYLGHNELQFGIKGTGYELTRGGNLALHLSEGERTAIAFLYFLKSLKDKDFNLRESIVVIDDPVSSLDANALFSAFGYMKERTKECHQLFILTHNFAFFRQIKNWFHHIKGQRRGNIDQRPCRFYSLFTKILEDHRAAMLSNMDRLLQEFESEYHFLFKQVHDVAKATESELEKYCGMPNIARRLIETFLAYRFPDCEGDLIKRFDRVDFDPAKKTRIIRLLNTYSHSSGISDPESDPSALAETRDVMKTILELIQSVDDDHYKGMMKLFQLGTPEE